VRTPAQTAALLVAGTLERAQWPELADEDFASEVGKRLDEVGLELVGAAGRWLARPQHVPSNEIDGFEPVFGLNTVALAVIAALYMHLRYLPRHAGGAESDEEPSMAVEELLRAFPRYKSVYILGIVLGEVRKARFVRRENDRLYAGPYLAALNEIEADERSQVAIGKFQQRRHLKQRAKELEGEHAPD
jgi:hypothetical protein